jgi:hypothetical protein
VPCTLFTAKPNTVLVKRARRKKVSKKQQELLEEMMDTIDTDNTISNSTATEPTITNPPRQENVGHFCIDYLLKKLYLSTSQVNTECTYLRYSSERLIIMTNGKFFPPRKENASKNKQKKVRSKQEPRTYTRKRKITKTQPKERKKSAATTALNNNYDDEVKRRKISHSLVADDDIVYEEDDSGNGSGMDANTNEIVKKPILSVNTTNNDDDDDIEIEYDLPSMYMKNPFSLLQTQARTPVG